MKLGFNGIFGMAGCLVVAQMLLFLALAGGLIYFVAFACTHWLRW